MCFWNPAGLVSLVVGMAGEDPVVTDIGEQKAKEYATLRIRLTLVKNMPLAV